LGKHSPWVWEAEQQETSDRLKAEISTEGRILRHEDPNKPLILHTDWSREGIGAVLGQIDDEGRENMIACISRSLYVHERNCSSPQEEVLAAVWAVKIFHTYLHGQQFTLVTDHQPLTYMMTKNDLAGIFARWAIILQQYTFMIVYRPGEQHQNADSLSRQPQDSSMDTSGACLHDEFGHAPKCTLTLQLQAMQAVVDHDSLQQLYALPPLSTFSDTFAPDFSDIVSIAEDAPELPEYACFHATPLPKLLQANLRVHHDDVACKGGVMPDLTEAFFACNTTSVPEPMLQQTACSCQH